MVDIAFIHVIGVGKPDITDNAAQSVLNVKCSRKNASVSGLSDQTTSIAALFCFPVSMAQEINDDRTRGSWSAIHISISRIFPASASSIPFDIKDHVTRKGVIL